MGWQTPTTYLQRLGDALELLCKGCRPQDKLMDDWLHSRSEELQNFAAKHGPEWAQGIAVIDAAMTLADQPTEILTIDGPQVDHESKTDYTKRTR